MMKENEIKQVIKDIRANPEVAPARMMRYLVDSYYSVQEYRKRASNQVRACTAAGDAVGAIDWLQSEAERFEQNIKKVLAALWAAGRAPTRESVR